MLCVECGDEPHSRVNDDLVKRQERHSHKAVVPALGQVGFYNLIMCFVFDMSKGVSMSSTVSFGIAVFIGLSLAYRR